MCPDIYLAERSFPAVDDNKEAFSVLNFFDVLDGSTERKTYHIGYVYDDNHSIV